MQYPNAIKETQLERTAYNLKKHRRNLQIQNFKFSSSYVNAETKPLLWQTKIHGLLSITHIFYQTVKTILLNVSSKNLNTPSITILRRGAGEVN